MILYYESVPLDFKQLFNDHFNNYSHSNNLTARFINQNANLPLGKIIHFHNQNSKYKEYIFVVVPNLHKGLAKIKGNIIL